jgi:hypothetical protein
LSESGLHEHLDAFALERIRDADGDGLGHGRVRHQGALNLHGADPVASAPP